MDTMERYALWLLPDENTSNILAEFIKTLGERFGGPRFTPHITVFGRISGEENVLSNKVLELSRKLQNFKVRPKELTGESYYFRSFYIALNQSAELIRIGQIASELLQTKLSPNYRPHLSLLYGNQIRKHRDSLKNELSASIPTEFIIDRLQLVRLQVSVADWQAITTCELLP